MKLAVSNIAWPYEDETAVLNILKQGGAQGVEVAPTKIWPDWKGASPESAEAYRKSLNDQGLEIPALQAILFGRPELQVFDRSTHNAFFDHLNHVAELAHGLGAKVLVFGAPKNRQRRSVAFQDAWPVAVDFFRAAGQIGVKNEVAFGLEANPVEYQCDFLTNLDEVVRMVGEVDSPGIGVHLDAGAMYMTGDLGHMIRNLPVPPCHYHASEPMLAPVGPGVVDHGLGITELKKRGYADWVSIEMRQAENYRESIQIALDTLRTFMEE